MMSTWTRQQGFPVLLVNASDARAGHLSLRQQWFLADGSEQPGDETKLWHVPLLPGPASREASPSILETQEMLWQAPNGAAWVKFNFGQLAPYRVLYDSPRLRTLLAGAVGSGQLSAVDRIGLLLDAMAFAKQGQLPIAELLRLVAAFKGEQSTHAWQALSEVLTTLHRAVAVAQGDFRAVDVAVGNGLLQGALHEVGFRAKDGEEDLVRHKRALVVGLATRYMPTDKELVKEARQRFESWLKDPLQQDALPDDLKTSIFKVVLINAETDAPYRALRRLAKLSDTPQAVRLSIYSALGAARRKDLRRKTLDMALGGRYGVRLQDIMYPVQAALLHLPHFSSLVLHSDCFTGKGFKSLLNCSQGVSSADPSGARLAWRWFIQRRGAITARLQGANVRLLGVVIQCAAGALPEKAHANAVQAWF